MVLETVGIQLLDDDIVSSYIEIYSSSNTGM